MALRLASPALVLAKALLREASRSCLEPSLVAGSRREASSASLKERLTRDLVLPVPNGQLAGKQWGARRRTAGPGAAWLAGQRGCLRTPGAVPQGRVQAGGSRPTGPRPVVAPSGPRGTPSPCSASEWARASGTTWPRYNRTGFRDSRLSRDPSRQRAPASSGTSVKTIANSYTRQEVMDVLSSRGHVSASAQLLMARGCRRVSGDRYVFTTDRRVRCARPQGLYPGVFDRTLPRYRNNLMVLQRDCRLRERPHLDALEAIVRCLGAEECARFSYVVLESEKNTHAISNRDTVASRVNEFMCT
ncbi:hypothetical protein MRX96_039688 [Rhipicephalus microplus]